MGKGAASGKAVSLAVLLTAQALLSVFVIVVATAGDALGIQDRGLSRHTEEGEELGGAAAVAIDVAPYGLCVLVSVFGAVALAKRFQSPQSMTMLMVLQLLTTLVFAVALAIAASLFGSLSQAEVVQDLAVSAVLLLLSALAFLFAKMVGTEAQNEGLFDFAAA